MQYLIDTDWAINALERRRQADAILRPLFASGVGLSIVSVGELYEGAYSSPNPEAHLERFHRFLLSFRILGLDEALMRRFGELRFQLRRQGQLIPDFDLLIAASALYHDLTLLTFNRRHFERVTELRIYRPA